MKAIVSGAVAGSALAVVGVWDPLLPVHRRLFAEVCASARTRGLCPLAVIIDPDPGQYLYGRNAWPVYHDIYSRIRLLHACGFRAVLRLRFYRADLFGAAADFFHLVMPHIDLGELWLGSTQSLGSGPEGGRDAIEREAAEHGVALRFLPEARVRPVAKDVRQLLQRGKIAEATAIVGLPPLRERPRSGRLSLAWPSGVYRVLSLEAPDAPLEGTAMDVCLMPRGHGLSSLCWPAPAARYVAFVAGVGDA